MPLQTRLTEALGIRVPVVQGAAQQRRRSARFQQRLASPGLLLPDLRRPAALAKSPKLTISPSALSLAGRRDAVGRCVVPGLKPSSLLSGRQLEG